MPNVATTSTEPSALPHASQMFATWSVRELAVCPWDGFWPFNPSVIRTRDGRWLCSVRCADYSMPGGRPRINATGRVTNRNVIAMLDPTTLEPVSIVEMHEQHAEPVLSNKVSGVEDLRLFETDADGLCAVATAMQFNRDDRQEIVVLELDAKYQIIDATPLRGMWSKTHQKNWTPYDKSEGVRLVYSLERGGVHNGHRMIVPRHGLEIPPMAINEAAIGVVRYGQHMTQMRTAAPNLYRNGSLETKVIRRHPKMNRPDSERADSGPFTLRGGTQLVEIEPNRWLGVAHGVRLFGSFKFYWHVLYTMNRDGAMLERSEPFKLSAGGIEFAAGLALDPATDRAVISFGTDDESAWLGVTTLPDLVKQLRPIGATTP